MKGWWPSPSGQASDPRCAALSLNGRGLWWSLCDAADGRGAVPLGAMTLDAVLLALSGRTPEAQVRAAWQELHGVRLACAEGGVIVLDLPTCDVRDEDPPAPDEKAPRVERTAAAASLRAWFSKLHLKTCAERVQWLDSEHGQRALNRLGFTRDEAVSMAEGAGQRKGRFGHERPAATRGAPVAKTGSNQEQPVAPAPEATTEATAVSPAPPSEEKEIGKESTSSEARAVATTEATHGSNPRKQPVAPDHPLVAALVAVGGIVEPDYETARHLEAALVKTGVTTDLATAWGADLATPTGRKVSWPWLRTPDRPVTASFLRQAKFSEGHEAWSRVGDGFTMWRHWYSSREKARAKLPPSPLLPAPPTEAEAREQARRFKEDLARRRAADQKDAAHG